MSGETIYSGACPDHGEWEALGPEIGCPLCTTPNRSEPKVPDRAARIRDLAERVIVQSMSHLDSDGILGHAQFYWTGATLAIDAFDRLEAEERAKGEDR